MKKLLITLLIILIFPIFSISKIVVVDPGHNYDDIESGYRTETEVNTNWAVANKLKNFIETDPYLQWDVVLTRNSNNAGENITIAERYLMANNYEFLNPGETYFLSIHCNGGGGTAKGTETFYCNYTFNSNNGLLERYANNVNNYIIEYGNMFDRNRCVEDATYFCSTCHCAGHLCVLKELTMPNCLNEIGFVDNIDDESKLLNDSYCDKFALAYLEAFKATFSDIEVVSYSFENLPCYSDNENFVKINVTVKNVTNHNYTGDVRAVLRHFPTFELDEITSDFCYLGNSQYVFLSPGQQRTLSFSANVPFTMEVGMALCIEAKHSTQWENVPTPSHKRIIKVPINGAKITGVVYGSDYNPLQGVGIWSYQYPSNKSATLYSDIFDPTRAATDRDGKYDLLVPSDWDEAVISAWNYANYNEIFISPIANMNLVHYYTSDPVAIGVGSGSGACGGISGQSPEDPREIPYVLDGFEYLGVNEQPRVAFVKEDEQLVLGVFPKPVNYSKTQLYACGGSVRELVIYFSHIDCYIPFFWEMPNYYYSYQIKITEIDEQNNPIGIEKVKEFIQLKDLGDVYLIGEIDLNQALNQMNIVLQAMKRYRIKLGYYTHAGGQKNAGEFMEKQVILNVYSSDIVLDDSNLTGEKYSANNIVLKNANIKISSELELLASNQIRIQPGTFIKGKFHAYIGTEKSAILNVNNKNNTNATFGNQKILTEHNYEFKNRYVSAISNICPCKGLGSFISTDEQKVIFRVYPNPVRNNLIVLFNIAFNDKVEILNLDGKLVKSVKISGNSGYIPVVDLPSGEYILKIKTFKGSITSKFVKI